VRDRCCRLVAIDRYYAPRGIVLTDRSFHNCAYSLLAAGFRLPSGELVQQ
jgi:hypothetical protein